MPGFVNWVGFALWAFFAFWAHAAWLGIAPLGR